LSQGRMTEVSRPPLYASTIFLGWESFTVAPAGSVVSVASSIRIGEVASMRW
jgi:hypothetical protein